MNYVLPVINTLQKKKFAAKASGTTYSATTADVNNSTTAMGIHLAPFAGTVEEFGTTVPRLGI